MYVCTYICGNILYNIYICICLARNISSCQPLPSGLRIFAIFTDCWRTLPNVEHDTCRCAQPHEYLLTLLRY